MSQNSALTGLATKTYNAADTVVMIDGHQLYAFGEDTMYTTGAIHTLTAHRTVNSDTILQ